MKFLAFSMLIVFLTINTPFSFAQASETSRRESAFVLQDGTPVKLRVGRNLSSADATTGETVDFEVLEDVKIGDVVVIPREGVALATVTQAKAKGRMGRGGKLDLTIDSVRLTSGEKVALRAVKETKGGNSTGAMTGAIVATSILFFPAAPFFLFMKGKDIKIPKGTEVTAYVNGDIELDRNKFVRKNGNIAFDATLNSPVPSTSKITISSIPEGADIYIDGKFIGSTPSILSLAPGDHIIKVTHSGYKEWERTISSTSGGDIKLNASLERIIDEQGSR